MINILEKSKLYLPFLALPLITYLALFFIPNLKVYEDLKQENSLLEHQQQIMQEKLKQRIDLQGEVENIRQEVEDYRKQCPTYVYWVQDFYNTYCFLEKQNLYGLNIQKYEQEECLVADKTVYKQFYILSFVSTQTQLQSFLRELQKYKQLVEIDLVKMIKIENQATVQQEKYDHFEVLLKVSFFWRSGDL